MEDQQHSAATKYAFITNGVARALQRFRHDGTLPDSSVDMLRRGEAWLLEMRRGAALLTGTSPVKLGHTAESIPAANRALSVVERLSLASEISEVQALLTAMEAELGALAAAADRRDTAPASVDLDRLERFFVALGQTLTREATAASFGRALEEAPPTDKHLSLGA